MEGPRGVHGPLYGPFKRATIALLGCTHLLAILPEAELESRRQRNGFMEEQRRDPTLDGQYSGRRLYPDGGASFV